MSTEAEKIAHLTAIIKANRLHEAHCPAFSTSKGDFAGLFQGMAERECLCWLDKDNVSEPGTGFGHYDQATKEIQQRAYSNKHDAYRALIDTMGFSEDKEAPNYWWKHYLIVPITYEPAKED